MKVFVSGCFDMLHSGHVAFFKEAAQYGEVYVGIGSDRTIEELKGRGIEFVETDTSDFKKAIQDNIETILDGNKDAIAVYQKIMNKEY